MPKSFYKHKLLFDENMPPRSKYQRLNNHFDVKHIRDDLHRAGATDTDVYKLACKQGRIIVTINRDDFTKLIGTHDDMGVIALSDGKSAARVDAKLTALLIKHGSSYFKGKVINLNG